jgi:ketosteroid isomerase-like protein
VAAANLDLVRSIVSTWERGDFTAAEWADPEIEYVIADGPTVGSWTGIGQMAEANRHFLNLWEDFRVKAEDYREVDDGRVLVFIQRSGRGKTSGLDLEQLETRGAFVFQLRGGKVTRLAIYYDRERALGDLGLPAEASSSQ